MEERNHILPTNNDSENDDFLSNIDLEKIWEILKKSILWMLILPLLTLSVAHIWLRYTKPVYESSSSLKLAIKDEGVQMLGIKQLITSNSINGNLIGEVEFIRSQIIFNSVIDAMDLWVSYYEQGNILEAEYYTNAPFKVVDYKIKTPGYYDKKFNIKLKSQKEFELSFQTGKVLNKQVYKFNQTVKYPGFSFKVIKTPFYKKRFHNIPFYFKLNSRESLIRYLNTNLQVGILNRSARIIGVNFRDFNPLKAKHIVHVIDTTYLQKTLENKKRANIQQKKYLNRRLNEIEDSMRNYEAKIQGFKLKLKTNNINEKLDKSVQEIEQLIKKKLKFTDELAGIKEIENLIAEDKELVLYLPENTSGLQSLTEILKKISKLQEDKKLLDLRATSSSMIIQNINQQLNTQKAKANRLIAKARKGIYKKIVDIEARINALETAFGSLPEQEAEFKRVQRLYKIYEGYYLQLLNRKAEIGISEAGIVPEFDVLKEANIPTIPISPRKFLIYAVAGGFGIFLSFALVVIRYLLHNKVTNLRELERVTKVPVLGTVPRYRHRKLKYTKLLVHRNPKSSLNESLRSIRTNLAFLLPQSRESSNSSKTNIISVTSTISGEGKTFVATNLGGIIAMSDRKVVLLDCDMRKPKVHIAFDEENDVGVSNILIKQNSLQECIKPTEIKQFDFIAAGPTPPNPSELLLREDFDQLIEDLKEIYDVIMIDTPPVGLVTDGVLIMQKVDVPLYVVKAHYSRKIFGKSIDKLVQAHNFRNLSIVLNSVKHATGYGGYKYGYGYGNYYGGYYEDNAQKNGLLARLFSIFKRRKK
ncbi:MAG TPA: hypothetical protein DCS93_18855 [Microscillaceae bacterium]|nr:hypothetical protein [Microscillaceae bacterium]